MHLWVGKLYSRGTAGYFFLGGGGIFLVSRLCLSSVKGHNISDTGSYRPRETDGRKCANWANLNKQDKSGFQNIPLHKDVI
jgi:hypothetical protein